MSVSSPQEFRPFPPPRIAIVLDTYVDRLFAGIAAYARARNWDLEISMIRNPGTLPRAENWAGILASVCRPSSSEWLSRQKFPTVHLISPDLVPPQAPVVMCDLEAIGCAGAQHLMELGSPHFAFYRRTSGEESRRIQAAFKKEIERHGFPVTDIAGGNASEPPGPPPSTRAECVHWLSSMLQGAKFPLAVMAEDDRFAVELQLAAQSLGLRVPEDIAILGAEDDSLTVSWTPVPLSSIDTNYYEIGRQGAELLDRLMGGALPGSPEVPLRITVPPKGVVVRESTATFVCSNPTVTAAAMFVRRNFRETISVEDVAAAANISVRRLQEQYPAHVGHTIKDDIIRQRLRAAKYVLERTDLKLAAVAAESGFGTLENFCKVFRRECGMTPLEWREGKSAPLPEPAAS